MDWQITADQIKCRSDIPPVPCERVELYFSHAPHRGWTARAGKVSQLSRSCRTESNPILNTRKSVGGWLLSPTRRVTAKTTARCRTAGDTSQTALEAVSSPGSTGRAPADPAASVEAQRYRSAPGWNAANLTAPRSERSKPCSTALTCSRSVAKL